MCVCVCVLCCVCVCVIFVVVSKPGFTKVVKGQGMPLKKQAGRGDLIVEFDVLFPQGPLTAAQKQKIREAGL